MLIWRYGPRRPGNAARAWNTHSFFISKSEIRYLFKHFTVHLEVLENRRSGLFKCFSHCIRRNIVFEFVEYFGRHFPILFFYQAEFFSTNTLIYVRALVRKLPVIKSGACYISRHLFLWCISMLTLLWIQIVGFYFRCFIALHARSCWWQSFFISIPRTKLDAPTRWLQLNFLSLVIDITLLL